MKKKLKFVRYYLIIFIGVVLFTCANNSENQDYSILLKRGREYWNNWRKKNHNLKIVFKGQNYTYIPNYSGYNLSKVNLLSFSIINNNFSNTDLQNSIIRNITIETPYVRGNPDKYKTIFFNTKFNHATIIDSKMTMAVYEYVDFSHAILINSKFWVSRFNYPKFNYAKITKSFLGETILFADFSNAIISSSEIDNKIENTKFYKSNIINTSFGELGYPRVRGISKTKINNSDFTFSVIKKSRYFANIFNTNFSNAKITHTKFIMDFTNHLNFSNTILTGSSFSECNLTNVNFTNANLTNVNFQKAKFDNVIFKNADMTGTKLERKWYNYVKKQGVRNFDKINWQ